MPLENTAACEIVGVCALVGRYSVVHGAAFCKGWRVQLSDDELQGRACPSFGLLVGAVKVGSAERLMVMSSTVWVVVSVVQFGQSSGMCREEVLNVWTRIDVEFFVQTTPLYQRLRKSTRRTARSL